MPCHAKGVARCWLTPRRTSYEAPLSDLTKGDGHMSEAAAGARTKSALRRSSTVLARSTISTRSCSGTERTYLLHTLPF